jgi:DNA-binding SARP family transcriptional activator
MLADSGIRIQLCGHFLVRRDSERLDEKLRGRQARMLFAFLILNRTRFVVRDELTEAIWPYDLPSAPGVALRALLSNLRRCLGADSLIGGSEVRLALPVGSWVDVEAAEEAIHLAEAIAAQGDWVRAYGPAHVARYISERAFLVGHEAPWIDERRRELEELRMRALECCAAVLLGIGGTELPTAERTARSLIDAAPVRESGYRMLMEILDARDDRSEALRTYERLRCVLRDELGTSPGPGARAIHERLLGQDVGHAP